ncbi:MAG TPA: 23S rRNA (guanosine(2251)-2'-O)-methyltransferase RlmB [Actinomycetota bacterium]|nr:23S rRNA (guanosine(2251)-2'-O)-methyltransferase RlmB [Actinomycetota bacterium]
MAAGRPGLSDADSKHRRGDAPKDDKKQDNGGILWGRRPVLEVLKSGRGVERILVSRDLAPSGIIGDIRRRAEAAAVPLRLVPKAEVDKAAGRVNHQGVVAFTAKFRYAPLDQILATPDPRVLVLDGVTDPHNLGSVLRSADGAGFQGVVVPSHRSAGVTGAVRRVSAGAAEVVPVARVNSLGNALDQAKKAGLWIVGLDAAADEDLWDSTLLEPPLGLVLGAEDRGISTGVAGRCDGLVRIPSVGRMASLNVAVAGAIAMFEVSRKAAIRVRSVTANGGGPADGT